MIQNVAENIFFKDYYSNINNIDSKKSIPVYIFKNNEINMIDYFFNIIDNNNSIFYLGIDFEFNNINNKRHVALIQINFNDNFILMFHPKKLNNYLTKKLKKYYLIIIV